MNIAVVTTLNKNWVAGEAGTRPQAEGVQRTELSAIGELSESLLLALLYDTVYNTKSLSILMEIFQRVNFTIKISL